MKPRVLLVDDNAAILERVAEILSDDCDVVGTATDGRAAVEAVKTLEPDVVVLDVSMPGISGLEVALRLRRGGSSVAIVFVTVHDDEEFVRAAQAVGGIGYVVKSRLVSDLVNAVTEASAGRPYLPGVR